MGSLTYFSLKKMEQNRKKKKPFSTLKLFWYCQNNFSLEDENVIFFNIYVWIEVWNFNFVKEGIFCEE